MKTFDPTKPVQTRDGRKVRIICTDVLRETGSRYDTIVALVSNGEHESALTFQPDGRYWPDEDDDNDLINIPEVKSVWHWQYTDQECRPYLGNPYLSRDVAKSATTPNADRCLYRFDLSESGELTMHKEPLE